jgi:hypothetical protein
MFIQHKRESERQNLKRHFFFDCTVESFNIILSFVLHQFAATMPSLTVPNTKTIKTKNSCRRIFTRNTPPPLPSAGIIEAELKVKIHSLYLHFFSLYLEIRYKCCTLKHTLS